MTRSRHDSKRRLPLADRQPYTPEVLRGIAEGERRVARQALGDRGTASKAMEVARLASARAQELARAALARHPPETPIACKAGCSWCCSSKVLALAPEVLSIAEHLRATLAPEALAELTARVASADRVTHGLTRAERAERRRPCPLLVDGRCFVYEIRPIVCAGWTSLDADACERHWREPAGGPSAPVYAAQYELANAVLGGLALALLDARLEGRPLELIAALRIALTRDSAGERWARGLPVFSQAVDTSG